MCSAAISEEALRCSDCEEVRHLTCSRLPDYSLAMYMTTRNQYLCTTCVKKKKSSTGVTFDEAIAKITSLKSAELDVLQLSPDDTRNGLEGFVNGDPVVIGNENTQSDPTNGKTPSAPSIEEIPSDRSNSVDSLGGVSTEDQTLENSQSRDGVTEQGNRVTNVRESPNSKNETKKKKKLCKFYVKKTCKYGAKGVGCEFDHPPKCIKFMSHGDKNAKGCKKGKDCGSGYHPPICWDSLRDRVCGRENCKYRHLHRTKRREQPVIDSRPSSKTKPQQGNKQPTDRRRSYANALKPRTAHEQREEARDCPSQGCQENFLELKGLIQQMMQTQMRGLVWDPRLMASTLSDYSRLNANH